MAPGTEVKPPRMSTGSAFSATRPIENWFAYVLALAILLFRPQGLFGERIIERI